MTKKPLLIVAAVMVALVAAMLLGSSTGSAADETKSMSFSGSGSDPFFDEKTFCDVCVPDFLVDGIGVLALSAKVNVDAEVTGNGTLKVTPPDGPIQQGNVIPVTMQFTGTDGN
ncbi:MAG: hypothetical protein U1B78_04615, partial [Dehalococcoidia bacterium]|nr:hypothetical protein [Dehalococcoidia bacterium]